MVSFNLYNSSARSAAFAVAEGAGAALGFQDFVDDLVAEVFFANFYWHWRASGWNTLAAFRKTLMDCTEYAEKLRGSGIVLWSAASLVGAGAPAHDWETAAQQPKKGRRKAAAKETHDLSAVEVIPDVRPNPALNYSVLHNRQAIFETFSIYKLDPRELEHLRVEVQLEIGNETFRYQSTFTMKHHVLDLSNHITIGLTSGMARSLHESVRTTLFVRVECNKDRLVLSKTYPITLLPTDEWRDDELHGKWLPSFVLPRDDAVLEVIVAAQRYLMALRDDAFAGFDGYQPLDSGGAAEEVDAQVRAIWYALLHDFRLNYINPPPVFTAVSQRLRTPTDILRGGRGTCIDLALLIAACLEFIDIRPVIFLLKNHAFPGYWSSEAMREQFLIGSIALPLVAKPDNPTPLPGEEEEVETAATATFVQQVPWQLDASRYGEVYAAVQNGDIVPIESTMVTSGGGFWDAIEKAIENLGNPDDFHSMFDIALARDNHVTPLPLAARADRLPSRP
jgi:hypothetical protein